MRISLLAACAAVAVSCGPALAAQTAQAPRSAEAFSVVPGLSLPVLSPDGRKVATHVEIKGEPYLMIISLDGAKPAFLPIENSELNWWRWVNNDWLVIGVGDTRDMVQQEFYIRRAVGVSADGTKVVPLLKNMRDLAQIADDVIWTANDGSPRILLAAQRSPYSSELKFWPEVHEVDVSTGKSHLVQASREGILSWIADARGSVRVGIGTAATAISTGSCTGRLPAPPSKSFPAGTRMAQLPNIQA